MLGIDYRRLYAMAEAKREAFATAQPFPHAAFDDFFWPEVYGRVAAAFPEPDSGVWKKPENDHTKGKMVTKRGDDDLKEFLYDDAARTVLLELNSGLFLHFLKLLTGIEGLVADPYLAEAGFHCSENGGYLNVHADFSHSDQTKLERRLNMIFYVNDDWREEYGGALSLYDEELNPVASYLPIANRCVVFETSDKSYHGHPEKLRLPAGEYRKSIALYYYSFPTGRAKSRIVFPADEAFTHTVTQG